MIQLFIDFYKCSNRFSTKVACISHDDKSVLTLRQGNTFLILNFNVQKITKLTKIFSVEVGTKVMNQSINTLMVTRNCNISHIHVRPRLQSHDIFFWKTIYQLNFCHAQCFKNQTGPAGPTCQTVDQRLAWFGLHIEPRNPLSRGWAGLTGSSTAKPMNHSASSSFLSQFLLGFNMGLF